MIIKNKDYMARTYFFNCRKCSERNDEKRKFKVDYMARVKGAVLRCQNCGHLISKKLKLLDRQIKEGEK